MMSILSAMVSSTEILNQPFSRTMVSLEAYVDLLAAEATDVQPFAGVPYRVV